MAGVSRPPLLLLLLILSALGPRISFLLAYSASTRATAQCSSNGENPSPARGSTFDQCDGYYDVAGLWDGPFTCNSSQYIYCCGTCSSRYCCQCRLLRLDQANCPRTRPEWDSTSATIHIGVDNSNLDDDEKYDLDRDRSNMVVYVVAGLIVGLLLAGVLGRMWLKRARRAGLRALHMPRSLSEILRPRPASSRDEEVKRQAMHLTQARDMPRALKNHSDPARVEAMHVTALVSPLAPAQSHQHLACPPTAFSQATQPDLSCYTTLSRMGDKELNDYYTQKRHLAELAACGTLPVSITNPIPPSGTRQSPARDRRHKAYGSTPALDEPRIAVVPRGVNGAIQVYPTLGRTRHDGPTVQNVGVGDLGRWRHAIEQDFRYRADVYGSTPTLNKESRALNQQLPHYPNDDFLDWYCTSRRCARHPAAHLGTPRRPQEQLYATTARTGISRSQAFGSTPALNRAGRGPPGQMGWPLRSQAQQLPPPSQHSDYLTGESSEDYEPLPATLSRPRRGHHHGHKRSFEEDDGSQVALATLPSRLRTRAAQPSRPPSSGSGTLTPDRPSSAWRNHGEIPTLPRGTGVRTPGYRALPPRKASVTDSSDAEPGRTWNAATTLAKRQAFAGRRHMTQEQQSLPVVSRPQVFPTKSRNEVTV